MPSYSLVTRYTSCERVEREEPVGDARRDDDPVVGAELARLDERRRADAVEQRPDVDERDEGPAVATTQ